MSLTVSQEVFTKMVIIRIEDDLTSQALVLTPADAVQLREKLGRFEIERSEVEKEAERLKALTIYNGHSLPTINREKYEEMQVLTSRFDFEVRQRIKDGNEIIEERTVGVL